MVMFIVQLRLYSDFSMFTFITKYSFGFCVGVWLLIYGVHFWGFTTRDTHFTTQYTLEFSSIVKTIFDATRWDGNHYNVL